MVLAVVLVCLATYRVTRLLTADAFPPIAKARLWIARRWGDMSWQAYLSECPWCVSVYVGGLVTLGTLFARDDGLVLPALVWPTASAVAGLIAAATSLVEHEDPQEVAEQMEEAA